MAIDYRRTIQTWNGTAWVPATTGAYALRRSPYSTNLFVGSHVSNGSWSFGAVTSGNDYQLWYSGDSWATAAIVASFGTFPINAGTQVKVNEVEVVVGATEETNKLYTTVAAAISSFTSPDTTNPCNVVIAGTGSLSQYITISHADLISHVHITARGKFINIILGVTGDSVNKVITISNCSIWMGANDITTDRSYINFTFDNCDIYAYKSITFQDCNLINCRIFQPAGEDITLSQATIMTNCVLTQTLKPTFSGNGFLANVTDEALTTYSMITDPTL